MRNAPKYLASTIKNVFLKREHTICQPMWDSVFIDQHGEVYSCCHHRPFSFGSIYKKSLSEIWNSGKRLNALRNSSLHKSLFCFFDCNVLTKEEKELTSPDKSNLSYPKKVWLLFGELCNIECSMCWQNHKDTTTLNAEVLKKQIDWDLVEEVELQGGEVLAMREAKKFYLWLTQEKGKKVNIISNGMLINDEWAEHLIKGAEWVQISVNACTKETHEKVNRRSKFEKVVENIGKLVEAKKRLKSNTKIVFKYCAVPDNLNEIAQIIPFAEKLQCDEVAWGYDGNTKEYLASNKELLRKLREEVQAEFTSERQISMETKNLKYLNLL